MNAHILNVSTSWLPNWTPEEIREIQRADAAIITMMSWIKSSSIPEKHGSSSLQCLWTQQHHLLIQNDTLYWRWEDVPGGGTNKRLQLVLPSQLANDILSGLHSSPAGGHMGLRKTLEKFRSRFYWVGQRRDVETWCNSCDKCCSTKSPNKNPRGPLQVNLPQAPFEQWTY